MPTTLTRESIVAKLCQLAAEQVSVSADEVTLDTHFHNDLNFDSLDDVEYAMRIEEEFEITMPDEIAGRVRTVRDAFEHLAAILSVTGIGQTSP